MKAFITIYLLLGITVFGQFGHPKIVSTENIYDFGDINEGEIVAHDFVIFNRGTDTLKISRVKASCGCTAVKPTKTALIPEDSTTVTVKFNSQNRRGAQRKFVYIFSNDPDTPQLRLVFKANVILKEEVGMTDKPSIWLSQYTHNFGTVREGTVLDLNIDVMNNGKTDLSIQEIKSSCGCTAALLSSKMLKPDEKGTLKVKFDTKNLSGRIARTVALLSNDPVNPTSVLTIIANIEKG